MLRALVIHSGGQDSTTCLLWAQKNFDEVYAIHFQYGQRHAIETYYAQLSTEILGIQLKIVNLPFYSEIANSALLQEGNVSEKLPSGLPSSFVPNRNQLFITIAHAFAQKMGISHLVTGVCQTDYSGYPDCRKEFIDAISRATNLGSGASIHIHTPLMYLDKAKTFELADSLGGLQFIIENTMTCYEGEESAHDFGRGCGVCPACTLRKRGYHQFLEKRAQALQNSGE